MFIFLFIFFYPVAASAAEQSQETSTSIPTTMPATAPPDIGLNKPTISKDTPKVIEDVVKEETKKPAKKKKTKAQKKKEKARKEHKKMVSWDKKFQKLSRKNRAKFVRYWTKYYKKELNVKGGKLTGDRAVGICISETNLGKAGVGRAHKKNLAGCKIDSNGKFKSGYPKHKNYRLALKALVQYYKKYPQGYSKYNNKSSSLGR